MIQLMGDAGQIISPLYAACQTIIHRDVAGFIYLGVALLVNQLALHILKTNIIRIRPNGGLESFPSGHTAAAFLGAGFVARRYGWKKAIPAFALAIFVGYSRVYCRAHWVSDVVAGAALGLSFCFPLREYRMLRPLHQYFLL